MIAHTGQKLNTNSFFSLLFRHHWGYPSQIPGTFHQNVRFAWASRDIPNFLAATPSCGRPRTPKVCVGAPFSCLLHLIQIPPRYSRILHVVAYARRPCTRVGFNILRGGNHGGFPNRGGLPPPLRGGLPLFFRKGAQIGETPWLKAPV